MEEDRGTFEERWSQHFNEAEITPPPAIWSAIDAHLANQGMAGYKKQATIYRWVAAACLLLLSMVGLYTFNASKDFSNEVALNVPVKHVEYNEGQIDHETAKSATITIIDDCLPTTFIASENQKEVKDFAVTTGSLTVLADNFTNHHNTAESNLSRNHLIVNERLDESVLNASDVSTASLEDSRLPMDFHAISRKDMDQSTQTEKWEVDQLYGVATPHLYQKNTSESQLWAGVSMGAGSFDPQFGGTGATALSSNALSGVSASARESTQSTYAAGTSVSGGVNLGGRIDRHFVLSGGVHYSAFSTGSADRYIATDLATNRNYALAENNVSGLAADAIDSKADYALNGDVASLNNQFQYLTIPVKAGYIVLDKQFNITLNSGMSSNFLIDARLNQTGGSGEINDDLGTSQNYKSVYFNFISSVEFGYTLQKKYMISVEPNYNQALSSFTNSNNLYSGKPKNFGLSVGLRYNF